MLSKVLSFQSFDSLSIVQLATAQQNTFNYISGSKAVLENKVEVVETSQSGSVNDLLVINNSQQFVFFMDGDILSGAKQNRVLNTSVLLAPQSKSVIPVSCVERGRWHYKSAKFGTTTYSAPIKLRADKAGQVFSSLSQDRGHYANQGAVWENVNSCSEKHNVRSSTSCLSDVYDRKEKDLESFIEQFKLQQGSNAIAIFINKRLLSIDSFGSVEIFEEYFPRLLKGAAIETYGLKTETPEMTLHEAAFKEQSFLDRFEGMEFEEFNGAGIGKERRFNSDELTGFELIYNNDLIHLTALNKKTN